MRKKIAAGNWKMYKSMEGAIELASALADADVPADVRVILGVPFVYINKIKEITGNNKSIFVSAQNCHQKNEGAYTGEISPMMLKSLGLEYVILGHSERREYFGETPELLKEKIVTALQNGLNIIFCCGEPLDIRKAGNQEEFVRKQLSISLSGLTESDMKKITIAYEPIWAIGTGETATPDQAQEMHMMIRNFLKSAFSENTSNETSILYGGSVKASNAAEIFAKPDVDGGLVGGASLEYDAFNTIINSF